jgi:hypothetical protein
VSGKSKDPEQFRKDAVELVRSSDRTLRQVARELGSRRYPSAFCRPCRRAPRLPRRFPQLKVKDGTADFCLDPLARTGFDTASISMSADAPAQLVTTGPQPCATTQVTVGAIAGRRGEGRSRRVAGAERCC